MVGQLATRASLALVGAPLEDVRVEVAPPVRPDAPRRVRVTCTGRKTGNPVGQVIFRTGLEDPPELPLSWACNVRGTLSVNPTTPYFNLKSASGQVTTLEVDSPQPGFRLHGVRVLSGPFFADIDGRADERPVRVRVQVNRAAIAADARSATGTLLLESNDRTEPSKEIPLFGFWQVSQP